MSKVRIIETPDLDGVRNIVLQIVRDYYDKKKTVDSMMSYLSVSGIVRKMYL